MSEAETIPRPLDGHQLAEATARIVGVRIRNGLDQAETIHQKRAVLAGAVQAAAIAFRDYSGYEPAACAAAWVNIAGEFFGVREPVRTRSKGEIRR